jgi:hypothetical protein
MYIYLYIYIETYIHIYKYYGARYLVETPHWQGLFMSRAEGIGADVSVT